MEQKINSISVDPEHLSEEQLKILRNGCERAITARINDVNTINVELNSRQGRIVEPEFGFPLHSITPEEDDPFLESVHPEQLKFDDPA